MSAFVPGPGLSLSSNRVFFTGSTATLSRRPTRVVQTPAITETSAIKLPKLPKLPSLPDLPFGRKKPASTTPPPTEQKPVLKVGGKSVEASKPEETEKTAVKRSLPKKTVSKLPKFYNPPTARYEFAANAKGQNATAFDVRVGRETNTTNRRINEQGTLRNMDPYTDDLLWARPGWSSDEARVGVRVAIKKVFGNANLFDSDLAELATSISCVTETADMKEFVRALGLSSAYRKRFFESTSNTRFIELNFLHFLGRAPHTQEEVSAHIQIINDQGYNAEINSYIDSDEYDTLWGESRIPAINFRGGHPYNNDMNKIAVLNGGFASTDRASSKAYLVSGDATGFNPYSIRKGLPEAWVGENSARAIAGPVGEFDSSKFWNPQPNALMEAELAWKARYGSWNKFYYKDSAVYKEIMKPKLSHSDQEMEEAAAILKYGTIMAKNYVGSRKTFDMAPVIELRPPTSAIAQNGVLSVSMQKITFPVPSEMQQAV
ncbi:Phycobilisome 27.9 kDa linker polypeptide, phycoerythrin-associated, rod [Gracilariopsis chorda]|uniref:Phycobilisome 27.9 kDa linker polypeptide, phycoerythrin-associated, rod n=1 Tax=Gracilariopsis chorda TaxID=448386 RepID=A0A2V3ITK3_9FLOR|nr:Phycobilisome 27.9 kDa linker polypeptide, phycoerythrin-associated, rod [Gracilariopsis chorda]|eukprot:PXF45458.1 Phycobilisome 27.9 kDa linker polypeptide, phycoerythrin-associated, rod [Gracilariopsis chorda]